MRVASPWLLLAGALLALADGVPMERREAQAARKVYVAKCAKCHRFYEPRAYPEQEWREWMRAMSRKSKLKPAAETILKRYLDAYRAGSIEGKPEDAR